jgi:predicted regulator of Ras-like GTPase activity (Roadblock/LC7/MglB family)
MASPVLPNPDSHLTWLLSDLADRVPQIRSVALVSSDGLPKAVHGLDGEAVEHLAAVASGLCSLARSAGMKFGSSDVVRQVVAELDDIMLFVSAAGSGSVLAVLARRDSDAGVIGYEMSQLIKSVRRFLTTPARHSVGGDLVP